MGRTQSFILRSGGAVNLRGSRSGAKFCSVVRDPVSEGSRRNSRDVGNRGCDECGLADCGSPRIEEHVHNGPGHELEQFLTPFVWRNLFDAQRASNHATDDGELFELGQRLGPSQNIVRYGVCIVRQGMDRHASYVAFVDRGGWGGKMRPAHEIAGANLGSPPAQNVCGEHARAQEGPTGVLSSR
jgi:hypothetical protein